MHDEAKTWVDFALLLAFPGTVLTGILRASGPGALPGYWHTGMSLWLVVLVFLHLLLNERGLNASMKRLRELIYGTEGEDPAAKFEERDRDGAPPRP